MNKLSSHSIFQALAESGIDYLITVPTTGINEVYEHFQNNSSCIYATREEEAIELACGISLANSRPLVLMQQSGVGNSINAYLTLMKPYNINFSVLVLFRGKDDENPIHHFSALKTEEIIKQFQFKYIDAASPRFVAELKQCIQNTVHWIYCHY